MFFFVTFQPSTADSAPLAACRDAVDGTAVPSPLVAGPAGRVAGGDAPAGAVPAGTQRLHQENFPLSRSTGSLGSR